MWELFSDPAFYEWAERECPTPENRAAVLEWLALLADQADPGRFATLILASDEASLYEARIPHRDGLTFLEFWVYEEDHWIVVHYLGQA